MGQGVYKNGNLGEEFSAETKEEFEKKLQELLSRSDIDHVRIFNKENPEQNQVGIAKIEEKMIEEKIEAMIEAKINEALKKKDILETFENLKKQHEK